MTTATQPDDLRLAALVSAKLCHDLVGPLSALNMIVESLEDGDPEMIATSRTLILDSAAKAMNRLSFFWAAIGRGQNLGSNEAKGLIEKIIAESKIATSWDDALTAQAVTSGSLLLRLTLNLAYLAGHAIIGGGSVGVRLGGSADSLSISVISSAKRLNFEDAGRQALIAGVAANHAAIAGLDPRSAYAYFAGRTAAGLGLTLKLTMVEPTKLKILAERG